MEDDVGTESDEDIFSFEEKKPVERQLPLKTESPRRRPELVKLRKYLSTGVPAPPEKTDPNISTDRLVDLYLENAPQFSVWPSGTGPPDNRFGSYLNKSSVDEEFERLSAELIRRIVTNETRSSLTVFPVFTLTRSEKKRQARGNWTSSPNTRMNYLRRRSKTFSVSQLALLEPAETKQVLIPPKEPLQVKKLPRRALFQSPDRTPELRRSVRVRPAVLPESEPPNTSASKSNERRKCSRTLTFDETGPNAVNETKTLPTHHRQKMLWAVSVALKSINVTMANPEFKSYASTLYRKTLSHWLELINRNETDRSQRSTSDSMLEICMEYVNELAASKSIKTPLKRKTSEMTSPEMKPQPVKKTKSD